MSVRRLASRAVAASVVLALAALVGACSSSGAVSANNATCRPDGGTEAYPAETGCGTEAGQVIANLSFQGRTAGLSSPRTGIKLSDYYDPDGTKGLTYLVVDVSAFWCSYCKDEAPQLASLDQTYGPKGVVFLTVIEQDNNKLAAKDSDVDAWIQAYGLVTPAVSDPQQLLSAFFNPDLMPLNMIVDLRTMKIVKKFTSSALPQVQAELDTRLGGAT